MEVCGKEIRFIGKVIRIAHLDGEGFQFLQDPERALTELQKSRTRVDLFTFIQKLSDTSPKYSYPLEWDNFASLRISKFDDWLACLRPRMRTMVRKTARDGVVVREVPFDDSLIRGIHAINNETPVRQGRRFLHYGEDLETVRNTSATFLDRSVFIGAFFEHKLIGFAKLVSDEDRTQAGLMHILSMVRHRDKAPTNALIAQAVRSCAERRIQYLWYFNFSYGKKQHDSLAEFKRRNGFRKIEVPRYYVPLTAMGCMALHLGLHRSLRDWVPAPMADTYRRIRRYWYTKRFPGFEIA